MTIPFMELANINFKRLFEFSLNVYSKFTEFSNKNIGHGSKRVRKYQILC